MPLRGTIGEKPRRLVAFELLHPKGLLGARRREGRHRPGQLAHHAKTLPAGDKQPYARTRVEEGCRQSCYSIDEVLAVVQEKQHLLVAQRVEEALQEETARLLLRLQSSGYLLHDKLRLGEWRELDQPYPIRVGTREIPGHLESQSCLARTSRARQGQEPSRSERPLDLDHLPPASHEAGARYGQVMPARI